MFAPKNKAGEPAQSSTTIIGAGTVITGDIESNGDIRIDGTLVGNLHSKAKVLIGQEGVVEGDINGQQADIMGHVKGTVRVKDLLQLKGNCHVEGNLHAAKLQVEPTAQFNGQCHMSGSEYKSGEVKMSPNGHPKSSAAA